MVIIIIIRTSRIMVEISVTIDLVGHTAENEDYLKVK